MTSAIDPSKPADGVPAVKADLRANLLAAKNEIEALQAAVDGGQGGGSGRLDGAVIYAEDFGANPDGSTDCATAINNAITEASNYTVAGQRRGARVQLLKGTYLIGSTVQLKSLVDLAGTSMTATTIEVPSGANCRAIQTIDGDQILYGVHDLGVYGNASSQSADDGSDSSDNGGVYLLNAKAEPTAIGQYRFLGGPRNWSYNLLIQEVAGNGFMVQGNCGGFHRQISVRWTRRYGFYIDTNDGSFDQLIASRTGWSGLFFDGANSRICNVKTWFVGVELDGWASARDWAQTNDTQTYNRQFDDNKKAGCGYLIRGDRSRFSVLDTQDTAGIGLYVHSRFNWIDGFNADQIAQVNAGGSTTRYDGGGAPGFDWVDLNPGANMVAIYIRQNQRGYLRGHVYDILYDNDGSPSGSVMNDVLRGLAYNEEPAMELIVTGHQEIVEQNGGIPVESASPFRLNGIEHAANLA